MDPAVTQLVRDRAGNRCEYCHLPQNRSVLRFHTEHIVARQHGGGDELDNLALACPECNRRKGTNLTGVDPDTGKVTQLFNPRRHPWEEHFSFEGSRIATITAVGRTTARLLAFNAGRRLRLREALLRLDTRD
ncbi:MAG: HNH endonuclease [Verrucomicrobia bacterium]|nr:HNH endonuclease [Verrucomicrobiota bacterium]